MHSSRCKLGIHDPSGSSSSLLAILPHLTNWRQACEVRPQRFASAPFSTSLRSIFASPINEKRPRPSRPRANFGCGSKAFFSACFYNFNTLQAISSIIAPLSSNLRQIQVAPFMESNSFPESLCDLPKHCSVIRRQRNPMRPFLLGVNIIAVVAENRSYVFRRT